MGTGGRSHTKWLAIQPNSQVHDGTTFGVVRLTLHPNSYDWQFLPDMQAGNGTFTDKGSGTCHGIPSNVQSGNSPRAIPVVNTIRPGTTVSRFTVDFTSAQPGQAQVLFSTGRGCSGLVMTATGDQGAGTKHHVFIVTGNDMPDTVGDNGTILGTTYRYKTVTITRSGSETDDNGGKCYSVSIPPG